MSNRGRLDYTPGPLRTRRFLRAGVPYLATWLVGPSHWTVRVEGQTATQTFPHWAAVEAWATVHDAPEDAPAPVTDPCGGFVRHALQRHTRQVETFLADLQEAAARDFQRLQAWRTLDDPTADLPTFDTPGVLQRAPFAFEARGALETLVEWSRLLQEPPE